MEKNKSNNLAVCIICGVLTAFGIVASVISLAKGISGNIGFWMVSDIVYLILSVLAGYYAISGYRGPHGNLLKSIILIYAATYLPSIYRLAQRGDAWSAVISAIIIGLCCYIAGRLHRVKQNIILIIIVTALILLKKFMGFTKGSSTIGALTPLIIWIDICVAYFLRYKEHKLAGLMDKADN